jgi:L-aspartate oxidase
MVPQTSSGPDTPRYLIPFDASSVPHLFTNVLVIGSGVAGLSAAIEAGRHASVTVITKDELKESNTAQAQGGIAAVFGPDDTPADHAADTISVGCGLSDAGIVNSVVGQAPGLIQELRDWGAAFDLEAGELALAREGGHGHARVVHAHGDSTGLEIEQTLIRKLAECENVRTVEHTFVVDLLTLDNTCLGAVVWSQAHGVTLVWANAVILATGGAGQVYRETTNPPIATGDGMAMAYRAGCEMRDLEFVQFHPTTLYVAGAARVLISEAARGEGGRLVNKSGERFMANYSPMEELAPRDVVSRAILAEMHRTNDTNVYLDLTHVDPAKLSVRFPRIKEMCMLFEIDISEDRIPVCPSAHYMVGGVTVDPDGRTAVEQLYACGEAASTGLHGANRLGSNSLLEGLVFGKAAGAAAGSYAARSDPPSPHKIQAPGEKAEPGEIDLDDVRSSLRSAMWRDVGIVRWAGGLRRAIERMDFWSGYVLHRQFEAPRDWRIQNMLTLAELITRMALEREESRGVHFRSDFPDLAEPARHSAVRLA